MINFFSKFSEVSCIIPAYNEAKTVRKVIEEAKKVKEIDEIIVVDDSSKDGTGKIAKKCGAKVVHSWLRRGKGNAMKLGLKHSSCSVILFLDADLMGLKAKNIRKLIMPVVNGRADFVKGMVIFTAKNRLVVL